MKRTHFIWVTAGILLTIVAALLLAIFWASGESGDPKETVDTAALNSATRATAPEPQSSTAPAMPPPTGAPPALTAAPAIPAEPRVTITRAAGQIHDVRWFGVRSDTIVVRPRQKVRVALDFGGTAQEIAVEALDGGLINGSRGGAGLRPSATGPAQFDFTAGAGPGTYQVEVRTADGDRCLRFWAQRRAPSRHASITGHRRDALTQNDRKATDTRGEGGTR